MENLKKYGTYKGTSKELRLEQCCLKIENHGYTKFDCNMQKRLHHSIVIEGAVVDWLVYICTSIEIEKNSMAPSSCTKLLIK